MWTSGQSGGPTAPMQSGPQDKQAAALQDGLVGARHWAEPGAVVAAGVSFLLTFSRWGRRFRIERR
jgi:hypothetical protein